jgi:hypothetical protein
MQYASRLPCISVEIHDLDQTSRCISLSTSISPICHRSMFYQNICLFRICKHDFPGQKGSIPPCRARPKPREAKAPNNVGSGLQMRASDPRRSHTSNKLRATIPLKSSRNLSFQQSLYPALASGANAEYTRTISSARDSGPPATLARKWGTMLCCVVSGRRWK